MCSGSTGESRHSSCALSTSARTPSRSRRLPETVAERPPSLAVTETVRRSTSPEVVAWLLAKRRLPSRPAETVTWSSGTRAAFSAVCVIFLASAFESVIDLPPC